MHRTRMIRSKASWRVLRYVQNCVVLGLDDGTHSSFYIQKLNTDWAKQTLATLRKMSPLALKVTLEQMRQGAVKNCAECFQMEYRLSSRLTARPDFVEGVRSVLIDKDRNPKWEITELSAVTPELVKSFFEPLPEDQELVLYSSKEN